MPVINKGGHIIGILRLGPLTEWQLNPNRNNKATIRSIMEDPCHLNPSDTIYTAASLMMKYSYSRIPVVDKKDETKIIGYINHDSIFKIYTGIKNE